MTRFEMDCVVLSGKGAETYLQGQITQDVTEVAVGGSIDAFVLEPSGKVHSLVTVLRAESEFYLLIDSGYRDGLIERLKRFSIRSKTEFDSVAATIKSNEKEVPYKEAATNVYRATKLIPLGFSISIGKQIEQFKDTNFEVIRGIRVSSCIPSMVDVLGQNVFPASFPALFESAVSLKKGCYTGQELVARMDSRGSSAPLVFRGFRPHVETALYRDMIPQSLELRYKDDKAGVLTSLVFDEDDKLVVAGGYLKRTVRLDVTETLGIVGTDLSLEPCFCL